MKNVSMILISMIFLIISLTGCTKTDTIEKLDTPKKLDTTEKLDTTKKTDTTEKTEERNGLDSQFKTYESKSFGFTIQFPISWGDNYIIKESEDYIEVNFVGDSETSKNYDENMSKINGLTMFYIGSEDFINDNEFIDSAQEIGRVHDINYYYFTSTDYPLGALTSEYIEDENEKKLALDDYIIAKEMIKDVENIIKTFKSLD